MFVYIVYIVMSTLSVLSSRSRCKKNTNEKKIKYFLVFDNLPSRYLILSLQSIFL